VFVRAVHRTPCRHGAAGISWARPPRSSTMWQNMEMGGAWRTGAVIVSPSSSTCRATERYSEGTLASQQTLQCRNSACAPRPRRLGRTPAASITFTANCKTNTAASSRGTIGIIWLSITMGRVYVHLAPLYYPLPSLVQVYLAQF